MRYSVIVLLDEQHEDFPRFIKNLNDVFLDTRNSFEIVLMANGTGGFLKNHL
jgi:intracellular sulfur oxidation DsrE/DsrF family protein